LNKNTEELEQELSQVNSDLLAKTNKLEDKGSEFNDAKPLANVKKAIKTVKDDIKSIDIRIGVVSNTILQLKLKERGKEIEDGKALEILDNEYEIEMN
jgi:estrogen-related receptor beta like 1